MKKSGFFLTFEGTDGVGKSTQAGLLDKWLRSKRIATTRTREPGGGTVAERIRNLILDPALRMTGLTELFLYESARIEHLDAVVRPALAEGRVVICDRFTDSTLAYQGYGRGLLNAAKRLNDIATEGLKPSLTILLDHPPEKGLAKARKRSGGADRLEKEGLEFQRRVRKGFLAGARREPGRIKVVRVRNSIEETQDEIRRVVGKHLGL